MGQLGFALKVLLCLHCRVWRCSTGGQNATPVDGRGCLGQLQVLTPSYRPHVPQQAGQECFLQGGSCTYCHGPTSHGGLQREHGHQLQGCPLAQFRAAGPPSSPRGSGFLRLLRSAATPWDGWPGIETVNSSNHSAAPGRAGLSSLLKWDIFLSCFLKKDLASNPTFYHLLAVWPSVNDGSSLSLSRHL